MKITIKELPDIQVAFIRQIGSYFEPQEHWRKLINWAIDNNLYPPNQNFIGISLDNPKFVENHKCRHDACVTIPDGFDKTKYPNMQFREIDGGNYALYEFYDTPEKLNHAYQFMFEEWLPNNKYSADEERVSLEFNMNNPADDPFGKCKVHLYVPFKNS
ncbi:GyrI-like domain-containing protein [Bacillus sp. CRN 9]|nr:GyrI-like domain-containing protein [Bacillus sp. CRN 9]